MDIQNSPNTFSTINLDNQEEGSSISVSELIGMFLSRWTWFVVSVFICLALGAYYLRSTPKTYTRSASVLIKDENQSNSLSADFASSFGSRSFMKRSNVDNEIINFQSPDLMFAVIKRLHIETMCYVENGFLRPDLLIYGTTNPYTLKFLDLKDEDGGSMVLTPKGKNQVELSDFTYLGDELDSKELTATIGTTVRTPLGRITIERNPKCELEEDIEDPIKVYRGSIYAVADAYNRGLDAQLENKQADVIDLGLQDENIERAEDILNMLITIYNENWIKDKNQILNATNEFIAQRLRVIESDLGSVDNSISSFKSQNMLPDIAQSANIDLKESSDANRKILDVTNQLSVAQYLQSYFKTQRNKLLPSNAGITDPTLQQQINQYNTLMLQRIHLVENSTEENPLVKDLDQQITALRPAIQQSINNYVVSLKMQLSTSESALAKVDSRISQNPRQAGKLLSVERQQKVKESLYIYLLQKREENELSQAFTAYNTRIVKTPHHGGSMRPTSPKGRNVLMISFVMGLAIPAGLIFLLASMNTKLRGRKDLEKLTAPFAGEIPQVESKKEKIVNTYDRIKTFFKPKNMEGDYSKPQQFTVAPRNRNALNEAFRVVRTNVEFMHQAAKGRGVVIMLTSANSGSGKTFISANLSMAFAIKDKRTLIVDLDMRKGSMGSYVGKPRHGIADYISGQASDYHKFIVKNVNGTLLDVLPVGQLPPNPAELLSEKSLDKAIDELRSEYDYIFLDCPPIGLVTDTDIIARLADITLFVVRARLLDRDMLPEIERLYKTQKFHNMALVLNGTDAGGHYGYKYGYHYGYRYGGYGYGSYGNYGDDGEGETSKS